MVEYIALIALVLPTYLIRFDVVGVPSTLLELLIWTVVLIGSLQSLQDRSIWQRLHERRIWLLPAALILVGAILGTVVAPDTRVALGLFKGFILDPILVYVVALAFINTQDEARWVGRGVFFGAAGIALWSLLDVGNVQTAARVIGPYALDANASPNYLAFALAPVLPLLAWLGVSSKKLGVSILLPWLWWIGGGLMLLGLAASDSRAGLVAGLGGLVIALVLGRRQLTTHNSQLTKILVVSLLLISSLSWFAVRPNFVLSPDEGGRITASNNVRWQLWSATGELVAQHWLFGTGLGGFQQRFDELTHNRVNYPKFITPRARTPHNLLVGMWMEIGLIGLIGLLAVIVLAGITLFRALRVPESRAAAAGLIGAWFVLLAHGLVDQPIWKNDTMVVFWLLVALSATLKSRNWRG